MTLTSDLDMEDFLRRVSKKPLRVRLEYRSLPAAEVAARVYQQHTDDLTQQMRDVREAKRRKRAARDERASVHKHTAHAFTDRQMQIALAALELQERAS